MKIVIASDKAGFELKEKVKAYLQAKGREIQDVGLTDPQGYLSFFAASDNLCKKITAGEAERGNIDLRYRRGHVH
jgi:ribose 5-phosphate isomerase B